MFDVAVNDWIKCADRLPKENVIVETKIDDGKYEQNFARLYRSGKLWFLEDGSMYVYYDPTHWKFIENERGNVHHERI